MEPDHLAKLARLEKTFEEMQLAIDQAEQRSQSLEEFIALGQEDCSECLQELAECRQKLAQWQC